VHPSTHFPPTDCDPDPDLTLTLSTQEDDDGHLLKNSALCQG